MSTPYLGEIRMFGGNFAPQGWSFCNGQLMDISQNTALFSLVGTTYGGDGVNTFALPNLQSRIPIHKGTDRQGTQWIQGQIAGSESITLTTQQMPQHNHTVSANASGGSTNPNPNVYGGGAAMFSTNTPSVQMSNAVISNNNGGTQPHDNLMPYLAVSFIIALEGVYPSQN